jgi:hypothetical protein
MAAGRRERFAHGFSGLLDQFEWSRRAALLIPIPVFWFVFVLAQLELLSTFNWPFRLYPGDAYGKGAILGLIVGSIATILALTASSVITKLRRLR